MWECEYSKWFEADGTNKLPNLQLPQYVCPKSTDLSPPDLHSPRSLGMKSQNSGTASLSNYLNFVRYQKDLSNKALETGNDVGKVENGENENKQWMSNWKRKRGPTQHQKIHQIRQRL